MSTKSRTEKHRELYRQRRKAHCCVSCGAVTAETLAGAARCPACNAANTEAARRYRASSENREKYLARNRELRHRRQALGLCIDCGKPTVENSSYCAVCLERRRAAMVRQSEKRRACGASD